jgi:hypothetical protein
MTNHTDQPLPDFFCPLCAGPADAIDISYGACGATVSLECPTCPHHLGSRVELPTATVALYQDTSVGAKGRLALWETWNSLRDTSDTGQDTDASDALLNGTLEKLPAHCRECGFLMGADEIGDEDPDSRSHDGCARAQRVREQKRVNPSCSSCTKPISDEQMNRAHLEGWETGEPTCASCDALGRMAFMCGTHPYGTPLSTECHLDHGHEGRCEPSRAAMDGWTSGQQTDHWRARECKRSLSSHGNRLCPCFPLNR